MRQKLIDIVLAVFGVLDDCVTILKQMVYVFSLLIQPRRTKFVETSGRDVLVLANGPSVKEVDLDNYTIFEGPNKYYTTDTLRFILDDSEEYVIIQEWDKKAINTSIIDKIKHYIIYLLSTLRLICLKVVI